MGKRKFSQVQNRIGTTYLQRQRQLYTWEKQIENGIARYEKMKEIAAYTLNCFEAARKENLRIHDGDIASFAMEKANEIQADFKSSDAWIVKFKKAYSIVDRAITKVITQNHKQVEDDARKRGDDESSGNENIGV